MGDVTVVVHLWRDSSGNRFSWINKRSYSVEHVNRHYRAVKRNLHVPFNYLCISDREVSDLDEGITQKRMWTKHVDLGICYHRLFNFSREFDKYVGDQFVSMDIDNVIVGDITPLIDRLEDFVYFKAPIMRSLNDPVIVNYRMCNNIYLMNTGSREFVWRKFDENPERAFALRENKKYPGSDQAWCNYVLDLNNEAYWTYGEDGIYDVKYEDFTHDLPENARIICFNNRRDPSMPDMQKKYPWIKDHWR